METLPHKDEDLSAHSLLKTWGGQVKDHSALFLLDDGATHNFISYELAQSLGIATEDKGEAQEALGAFKCHEEKVYPLVGKLRIHIQGYLDHLSFMIAPIQGADVILGMPWHKQVNPRIDYAKNILTIQHKGRDVSISAGVSEILFLW